MINTCFNASVTQPLQLLSNCFRVLKFCQTSVSNEAEKGYLFAQAIDDPSFVEMIFKNIVLHYFQLIFGTIWLRFDAVVQIFTI